MRTYVFASATVRRWLSAATSRWRERALAMRGASPCADRAPPTLPPPLVQLARPATARRRAGPGTAPLGALLFVGARQAVPWFAAFAGLVAVSAAMDPALSARAPDVPGGVVIAMFAMTVLGVATTTFVLLEYFVRARQRALAALELERAKSERLLLNVLPEPVAARLKEQEGVIADACPDVTVLFADIVGFTPLSERLSASNVVALLDRVFTGWDQLAPTTASRRPGSASNGRILY